MKEGPAWLVRFEDAAVRGTGPTVAVKDAIDIAGTVTTVGARARQDAPPADADAVCVAAVRRSGGRVVGKTNLSELCWFADGVNDFTGTPRNPIDPLRVPGGSSSGSAVAVALGEADVALGTDTGGSVRIPAACCGIAGLKTSRGRVSKIGVFPLAPELDTVGPLARDVAGLVTAMRLLEPSFGSATGAPNGMRRRVVRLRLGDLAVDPAVDAAVDAALDAAGWRVRELAVPGWREAAWESSRILGAGAGKAHAHLLERPELLSAQARGYIENGVGQSPERVSRARMLLADLGRTLAAALADDDAIVLPTLTGPPPLLREDRSELDLTWLTVPFNVLGWPAVSVPTVAAVVGAPVPASLQLVGLPRSEEHLLAAAAQLPSQLPA
ncbi:MAG: amidase [Actinomycetes bacterium]